MRHSQSRLQQRPGHGGVPSGTVCAGSRRKASPYRSALSMLTFYINRAGRNLPKTERTRLERAKVELKHQFGRE